MDPVACAEALRKPVGRLGGAWMLAPETYERAKDVGLTEGFDFYVGGRLGVIGDAPDEVLIGSAVFLAPHVVTTSMRRVRLAAGPPRVAEHFVGACQEWGRRHLADDTTTATAVVLGGQVVDAAPSTAAPLFAGWRAQALPDDVPAAAVQVLQVLRELRMARHAVAISVVGLSPIEAIISGPGGAASAEFFGWQPPYPDPDALRERRVEAERLTTDLMARDLEILTADQRDELLDAATRLAEQ